MRRFGYILLGLVLLMSFPLKIVASPSQQDISTQVDYTFGGQVTLTLQIPSNTVVQDIQVFLRSQGDGNTYVGQADITDGQAIYHHDLTTQPLRAFSQVEYWFRILPQTGGAYTTEPQSFTYEDNRFAWQTLRSDSFTVHWYEGDLAFGQLVLDAAQEGFVRAKSLINPTSPQTTSASKAIDIYVYASGAEMQSTLRLGALNWVAGHADPELGLMVVSLPAGPDQHREVERQIPHELMHILLYQAVGDRYTSLPTWFKEGAASANELTPNADYFVILNNAVEKKSLIPLADLCTSFPQDSSVYLAYAESDSFIRYLHQVYGSQGLVDLMNSYASGQGCENGSQAVMGKSLTELERQWQREALGTEAWLSAFENLLPWLVILLLVLAVPLGLTIASLVRTSRRSTPQSTP